MKYENILNVIDEKKDKLFSASDCIWCAAETAFSEKVSVTALIELLESEGFEITCPAYGLETAFTASFGSGSPRFGFLGEFDALAGLNQIPGVAEKKADHPGANGHGCGHNMLGVAAAGAAIAAKKYLEETGKSGTVIFYGCPGEEGGSGKAFMARGGAFKDLDFALTWHPSTINAVSTNGSLANFQVLFKFDGIAAHAGGCPELGRSALDAMEIMNVGANFLREHIVTTARLHYSIIDGGGYSPNVVQNHAEVLYLIRAPKIGEAKAIYDRVVKVAEGAAHMTETTMSYELIKSCANVIPNVVLEKAIYESMCDVPVPSYTQEELDYAAALTATAPGAKGAELEKQEAGMLQAEDIAFMESKKSSVMYDFVVPWREAHMPLAAGGSTDVGDCSWMCPTAQFNGCTWAPSTPGHSWQVVTQGESSIAHKGILYAAKALAGAAFRMLENPDAIAAAKAEWEKRLEGQTYIPIPDGIMPRAISDLVRK